MKSGEVKELEKLGYENLGRYVDKRSFGTRTKFSVTYRIPEGSDLKNYRAGSGSCLDFSQYPEKVEEILNIVKKYHPEVTLWGSRGWSVTMVWETEK